MVIPNTPKKVLTRQSRARERNLIPRVQSSLSTQHQSMLLRVDDSLYYDSNLNSKIIFSKLSKLTRPPYDNEDFKEFSLFKSSLPEDIRQSFVVTKKYIRFMLSPNNIITLTPRNDSRIKIDIYCSSGIDYNKCLESSRLIIEQSSLFVGKYLC